VGRGNPHGVVALTRSAGARGNNAARNLEAGERREALQRAGREGGAPRGASAEEIRTREGWLSRPAAVARSAAGLARLGRDQR